MLCRIDMSAISDEIASSVDIPNARFLSSFADQRFAECLVFGRLVGGQEVGHEVAMTYLYDGLKEGPIVGVGVQHYERSVLERLLDETHPIERISYVDDLDDRAPRVRLDLYRRSDSGPIIWFHEIDDTRSSLASS